jgi:ferrochelatase
MNQSDGSETGPLGVLLVNIGTPDSTSVRDVRRYLSEFLSDPEIIDLPAVARWLLLHGIILRTRPAKSAAKYDQIWTEQGSPLLVHGHALNHRLQDELGDGFQVVLGMRYGQPSIQSGLERLQADGCQRLIIIPLYPQLAASSTGSTIGRCERLLADRFSNMRAEFIDPFYDRPDYLDAVLEAARDSLESLAPDHVLFSFHSLPERHIRRADSSGSHCLESPNCCAAISEKNAGCYRAQCYETSRQLARRMELAESDWSVGFQSRLGRTPWIQPTTSAILNQYPLPGKRILVLTPSFVADCLETLEEVAIGLKAEFLSNGGEAFEAAPCPNSHPAWVQVLAGMVREQASTS